MASTARRPSLRCRPRLPQLSHTLRLAHVLHPRPPECRRGPHCSAAPPGGSPWRCGSLHTRAATTAFRRRAYTAICSKAREGRRVKGAAYLSQAAPAAALWCTYADSPMHSLIGLFFKIRLKCFTLKALHHQKRLWHFGGSTRRRRCRHRRCGQCCSMLHALQVSHSWTARRAWGQVRGQVRLSFQRLLLAAHLGGSSVRPGPAQAQLRPSPEQICLPGR